MEEIEKDSTEEKETKKEVYKGLYYDNLFQALQNFQEGRESFEAMDEEILQEIDQEVEEKIEQMRPNFIVKRISGLKFLVIPRDEFEELVDETE